MFRKYYEVFIFEFFHFLKFLVGIKFIKLNEISNIFFKGGGVKSLVKKAKEGRQIIVIDGCILQCAKSCLANVGVAPKEHIILTDYNFKKENNVKLYLENEMAVFDEIKEKISSF